MAVKDRFALLLDLQLPTLLSILHFVQHVGTTPRTSQHSMSIGKRLMILKLQKVTFIFL